MSWHSESTKERFWAKVDKSGGEESCWPWIASKNKDGYGRFKARGVNQNASRVCMEIVSGEPLFEKQVNHTCDNRSCCNPKHLYIGTQSQNMQDAYDRKRR